MEWGVELLGNKQCCTLFFTVVHCFPAGSGYILDILLVSLFLPLVYRYTSVYCPLLCLDSFVLSVLYFSQEKLPLQIRVRGMAKNTAKKGKNRAAGEEQRCRTEQQVYNFVVVSTYIALLWNPTALSLPQFLFSVCTVLIFVPRTLLFPALIPIALYFMPGALLLPSNALGQVFSSGGGGGAAGPHPPRTMIHREPQTNLRTPVVGVATQKGTGGRLSLGGGGDSPACNLHLAPCTICSMNSIHSANHTLIAPHFCCADGPYPRAFATRCPRKGEKGTQNSLQPLV